MRGAVRARGAGRTRAERCPDADGVPHLGVPDKAYLVGLGSTRPLTAAQVEVTENGGPVTGLAVAPPGGSASGAVMLIDASNSMKGAPIKDATVAARAFLAERKKDLPSRSSSSTRTTTSFRDFTTNQR